jgi:hypothetical protein
LVEIAEIFDDWDGNSDKNSNAAAIFNVWEMNF